MDFSNLQEPGDHSYTITASVFPPSHFIARASAALPGVNAVFFFLMILRGNLFIDELNIENKIFVYGRQGDSRMVHMMYQKGQKESLHNAYPGACRTFDVSVLCLFAPQGGV